MDLIVGLIGDAGFSPEDIEDETARLGHKVSRYTIMGWLYGSVRRPQNYTMTIVALACGYQKTWGKVGAPKAVEEAARQFPPAKTNTTTPAPRRQLARVTSGRN
jgi:hypothetical protein